MNKEQLQKLINDLVREWNQAEEFGQVHVADRLLDKINKLSKQLKEMEA